MKPAAQVELVQQPLRFLYPVAAESGVDTDDDALLRRVKELLLQTAEDVAKIPEIHEFPSKSIGHQSLVRFRCFVQDNGFSKEFYPRRIPAKHGSRMLSMKYHESVPSSDTGSLIDTMSTSVLIETGNQQLGDKQPYFAVSIPGETGWVHDLYRQDSESNSFTPRIAKDAENMVDGEGAVFDKKHPVVSAKTRRQAIIKFYDDEQNLSLNDTIEVVGVYEFDEGSPLPIIHVVAYRDLNLSGGHPEFRPCYSLPAKDRETALAANQRLFHRTVKNVPALRAQMIKWLSEQVCLGDQLVAEMLLLWSLGRVHRRMGETALGPLSLTINQVPLVQMDADNPTPALINTSSNWFVQRLKQAVDLLLPRNILVPLAVELLNTTSFTPTLREIGSDEISVTIYQNGYLDSGVLQLPSGTSLIIDETSMAAGQLSHKGVQNLAALRELLTFYSLTYQNSNGLAAFEKDLQMLIVRNGTGMLRMHAGTNENTGSACSSGDPVLPTDITVSLQAQLPVSPVEQAISVPEDISKFRLYLAYYRIAGPEAHSYDVPDTVAKLIEQQFVESRQNDPENRRLTQDDLFKLLSLARLMALSYGRQELDSETWEKTKDLYRQVQDRS